MPTILNTRWMCMTKGVTRSEYEQLASKGIYIGKTRLEDLCYYGDRYFLEYAIKNLPMMLDHFKHETLEHPYIMALIHSHERVPYTIYEHIKDHIKSEWDLASEDSKTRYAYDLINHTSKPLFQWLFKNIFSKHDNVGIMEDLDDYDGSTIKRYVKLLKYGNFFRNCNNTRLCATMFGIVRDLHTIELENDEGFGGPTLQVYVITKRDLKYVYKNADIEDLTFINAQDGLYRQIFKPSLDYHLKLQDSRIYEKYTKRTIRYIMRFEDADVILAKVLRRAFYSSVKAYKNILRLYKKLSVHLEHYDSLQSCVKYHASKAKEELEFKQKVWAHGCFSLDTDSDVVDDIVQELSDPWRYIKQVFKFKRTGQLMYSHHIHFKKGTLSM